MNEKELERRDATRDMGADLLEAVKEMKRGEHGRVHSPVAQVRYHMKLSQGEFAALLDVSVRTLQEWEQGRREPRGPARALLKIAAKRPDVLRELAA